MDKYADMLDMPRPVSAHPKMAIANRAKQFMPMDALRGFSAAVLAKQREKQLVTKAVLSEDAQAELEWKLRQLQPGDSVTVPWFQLTKAIGNLQVGTYITENTFIEMVDPETNLLVLPSGFMPFADILEIESPIFENSVEGGIYV